MVWAMPGMAFSGGPGLGLSKEGSASPGVQELAALVGSKMPPAEASAVIERLTGVKLPHSTLDREARRQSKRAQDKRQKLDEQMRQAQGLEQTLSLPEQAFTLVIELDAWNIEICLFRLEKRATLRSADLSS
jgi:hypothetical protein